MPLTFGEKIREARKQKNLTQKQLADLIGAAHNSISDWENNKNKPDPDTIELLCGVLKITPNYLLASSEDAFSPKEKLFIKRYRSLDSYGQETVSYILDRESERVASLQKQEDHIKQLESRPAAMIGIGADGSEDRMRFFSYYQRMASAGSGEFLFQDIPTDVIAVPDTPLSRRADFVIGVNGQSMEPTYFDGDKVLVEKTNSISIGEIGIFIAGTECFIKEAGKDRLISHNEDKEKYPDIIPDERRIDTVGRVLGRIGE